MGIAAGNALLGYSEPRREANAHMKQIPGQKASKWRGKTRVPRPKPPRLSEDIRALVEKADGKAITMGGIFDNFPTRSHALLFIFFGVPLSSPIGIPVLTTILGPTLALVSVFLALNKRPWLPRFLRDREISYEVLTVVTDRLLRVAVRVEKMTRSRLSIMGVTPPATRFHGGYAFLLSIMAALPIPIPFGNMVAAVPIVLLGIGLLERDGLFLLLAYLGAIPCIAFYAALFLLGREGMAHLILRLA